MTNFETFFQSYLITSLWSSCNTDDTPLDSNYSIKDISDETVESLKSDCQSFFNLNKHYFNTTELSSQAGHDFWLTQNRHGAGFWDGDWKEHGDILTQNSKKYKEIDLYVGDDGKIYK